MSKTIYVTGRPSLMDAAVKELEAMGFYREKGDATYSALWYTGSPISDLEVSEGWEGYIRINLTKGALLAHTGRSLDSLKLPNDWDSMMKQCEDGMKELKAVKSAGEEWIGKLVYVDNLGSRYPFYKTMFEKLGFASTETNDKIKSGNLCRVFAIGMHESDGNILAGCRTVDGRESLFALPRPKQTSPSLIDMTGKESEAISEFLRLERKDFKKGDFVTCLPGYADIKMQDKKEYGGAGYIEGMTFEVPNELDSSVLWPTKTTSLPIEYRGDGIYAYAVRPATPEEIGAYKDRLVTTVTIDVNGKGVTVTPGKSIVADGVALDIKYSDLSKMFYNLIGSSPMGPFTASVSHINIGCWKAVPVVKIQEILNAYNGK